MFTAAIAASCSLPIAVAVWAGVYGQRRQTRLATAAATRAFDEPTIPLRHPHIRSRRWIRCGGTR